MWRTDSLGKTLMLGKIEGRRRRGWQDKMVGWHHQLDVHEFEQALGVGDGQGSLTCCSPWGHKESDMTEQLNWTENNIWKYKTWNSELHKRNYGTMFMYIFNWIDLSKCDTCIPHPDPPSHLPLRPIPLGLPSAPGPTTRLMHPSWAGDLFHPR